LTLGRTVPRRAIGSALGAARRLRGGAPQRGPHAVLSSLCRGLVALGLPFEHNPRRIGAAETVGVISDLDALAAAIAWRRASPRRRLVAGPNLVILPSDAPELMTAPEIDLCLVPSDWVRDAYERDAPSLAGRIAVWPAGVDPTFWAPATRSRGDGRRALLYRKDLAGQRNASDELVSGARAALEEAGFAVASVVYGTFERADYRAMLQEADVVVFFSPTESQCLALVEAWAADVPAVVWSCGRVDYRGRVFDSSSAPYLAPANGRWFSDVTELAALLDEWDALRADLRPRDWVLENMTDEHCARAYWVLAHEAERSVAR
jgi:glycosyl transferase family 1